MTHAVDGLAIETQAVVNTMIRDACMKESWRLWRAIAQAIIDREVGEDWDYLIVESHSGPPEIVLTHYHGA